MATRDVGFRDETKELIDLYTQNGTLSYKQAYALFKAENYDEIANALKVMLSVSNESECSIWLHVINKVWVGAYSDEDRYTVFSENESIFFRELVRKNGVMSRKYVMSKVLRTPYMTDKAASNLSDLEVIDIFKLRNGDVIYTLSMIFLSEVRKSG